MRAGRLPNTAKEWRSANGLRWGASRPSRNPRRRPVLQPKSHFTNMNPQFGFMEKLISMFMPMNTDFDCLVKPKSVFVVVNIEFSWGEPAPTALR